MLRAPVERQMNGADKLNSIMDPIWGGECDFQQGHTLQEHF